MFSAWIAFLVEQVNNTLPQLGEDNTKTVLHAVGSFRKRFWC